MNIQYKTGHILALDGIRGVAILLVLFFHLFQNLLYPFSIISSIGWVGVDLFFVLSGFLITGILIDTKGDKHYFRNFFFKRILRIFPLYYFTLICFFIIIHAFHYQNFNSYLENQIYFWSYTENILFAIKGWPKDSVTLNHFWSLAVEEQFYLFWPFIIAFLNNKKILLTCFFLIITSLLIRNTYPETPFSYVFTFARMDSLSIGAIAAILIRDHREIINRSVLPVIFIISITIGCIIFYTKDVDFNNPYFIRFGYTLFDVLFACIIIITFDKSKLGYYFSQLFCLSLFRFFGKYSYGIYVYHWLFYTSVYPLFLKTFQLSDNLFILPFTIGIVLISILSYHLFELKFIKLRVLLNAKNQICLK